MVCSWINSPSDREVYIPDQFGAACKCFAPGSKAVVFTIGVAGLFFPVPPSPDDHPRMFSGYLLCHSKQNRNIPGMLSITPKVYEVYAFFLSEEKQGG